MQMLCALRAEHKWVMTGTPALDELGKTSVAISDARGSTGAPSNARWPPLGPTDKGIGTKLSRLRWLFEFIGQEPWASQDPLGRMWELGIVQPIQAGLVAGEERLMHLLNHTMIRALKSDLETLQQVRCWGTHRVPPPTAHASHPPPRHNAPQRVEPVVHRIKFTKAHAEAYNQVAEMHRRSNVLADMGGGCPASVPPCSFPAGARRIPLLAQMRTRRTRCSTRPRSGLPRAPSTSSGELYRLPFGAPVVYRYASRTHRASHISGHYGGRCPVDC